MFGILDYQNSWLVISSVGINNTEMSCGQVQHSCTQDILLWDVHLYELCFTFSLLIGVAMLIHIIG